MYLARILADSLSPGGARLTTFEATYPRFVHSELLTHRALSRNTSSSRAIPIEKMVQRIIDDPFIPVWWGKNVPGMQAPSELDKLERGRCLEEWLDQRDRAVACARRLAAHGLHKQLVNRILEPWMWVTTIISATDFSHFFALRCHPDAQPEIRLIADLMRHEYDLAVPGLLPAGEWHMPLVQWEDRLVHDSDVLRKIAVGRCARVSYLTHNGVRDPMADVELHDRLIVSGHWSPFEHVAMSLETNERVGNFTGFFQYRKHFASEHVQ